jgi:N-carbamoylputrescine amidase
MTRLVKIASVQIPAIPEGTDDAHKKEANFQAAEKMLAEAGQMGADIASLSEIFNVHGCELSADNFESITQGDLEATCRRIGAVAKQYAMYVIAPVYAVIDGIRRNSALLFDRNGTLIGNYDKVHCIEEERKLGVVPGDTWPVFHLDFGTIGIMICHDNSFPESARCLTVNGAEMIFWPHVMAGWGDMFMDVLMRAPAIHNGLHIIPVCYGYDPRVAWKTGQMLIGHSSIIAPDGNFVADAGRTVGIAFAAIDLDQPRVAHMWTRQGEYVFRLDVLIDRRPETYACLTRPVPPIEPLAGANIDQMHARVDAVADFIQKQDPNE